VKEFEELHPNCFAVFVFDNSSNHDAFAPDALRANKMNVGVGGVGELIEKGGQKHRPIMFRPTTYTNRAGIVVPQLMTFEFRDILKVKVPINTPLGPDEDGNNTYSKQSYEAGYSIEEGCELIGVLKGLVCSIYMCANTCLVCVCILILCYICELIGVLKGLVCSIYMCANICLVYVCLLILYYICAYTCDLFHRRTKFCSREN
jgi:hypothetical protein